jgi:dipeptidyl aminopeptidase/acylaminoacyl peptidase
VAGIDGGDDTDLALGATAPVVEERGDAPERLGERYRVVRVLGRGGMGDVYLAVDRALGAEVALKRVSADDPRRLRDEVLLAQKVTHVNVCRTYDLEEIEGQWLVKMEYVAGDTLAARLARGPVPVAVAVAIARDICAGLAAAHRRGVVHRDLKPANVMIERETERVVLMDFGIARPAALADRTAETVSGTPAYMAPEQVRGREVDARADLYALGCVLFEMLTGERPFPRATAMAAALAHVNDPPPPLPARVPKRLATLVSRLLEKDPSRRPASAAEVAAELAGGRRHGGWFLAGGALVLAAAAVVGLTQERRWSPEIRALEDYAENSDSPQFSPDGKLIAYTSDREERDRWRIYVEDLLTGSSRPVSPRELMARNPRWQRDGQALLGVDVANNRAYRLPLDGRPPTLLAEAVRFVEDCGGGRLLFVYQGAAGCARCARLALRERDGQERDLLRSAPGATIAYPRCDRAGRRVLYSMTNEITFVPYGPFDLWLLALDGGPARQLTFDRATNIGAFTPDGRSVVYSARPQGESHIWELALDGDRPPVQRTFGSGAECVPEVSPDGATLVYDVDITFDEMFEQAIDGSPARRVTTLRSVLAYPSVMADGSLVVMAWRFSGAPTIARVPPGGGEAITIAEGSTPSVAGDEILYTAGRKVLAWSSAGRPPRLLTELPPGEPINLFAGSDGRAHITLETGGGWEAWTAPLAGGSAQRELPAPWSALHPAPRGGWRVAIELQGRAPIRNRCRFLRPGAEIDDPGAREVAASDTGAWMPDGRSWIYPRDGVVHRYWVESGEDRVIATSGDVWEVALSPDGVTLYTKQSVGAVRRELVTNFANRPTL